MIPLLAALVADGVFISGGVLVILLVIIILWLVFFRGR
jgi:hypothetical protein